MNKIFIFPFILIIKFYQTLISPLLGSNCRFQPTCSEYCMDSLKTWGLFKGLYLSVKRIIKCHPWGGKGYDPVPKKTSRAEQIQIVLFCILAFQMK